jgi:hypothetical protein
VSLALRVRCYSGRRADERPTGFTLGSHDYLVEEVVDQWYGPDRTYFKVRADDGNLYILSHRGEDWRLDSFRRVQSSSPPPAM